MKTFITKTLLFISVISSSPFYLHAQNLQWAKTFGVATANSLSRAVAIDPNGNILTVGTFAGTVDFDPGAGVSNLTATSTKDVYISKLNAAGNFLWAKRLGGPDNINFPNSANGTTIACDLAGNVIVGGSFLYDIDINPDPAATLLYSVSSGTNGGADGYILKLNPNGDYLWSQQIGGATGDFVNGITTDAANNIFATGSFSGAAVDFDGSAATSNVTSAGQSDIFILKLTSTGAFGFVKTFGGTATDIANAINVDGSGNIYTTGYFSGTADFDPGAGTASLVSNGGGDVFISKLNNAGAYVWAKSFGGTVTVQPDQGYAITTDEQGNVFIAGGFRATTTAATVDFDPGPGTDFKYIIGAYDLFVCKYTSAGNYVFGNTAGSVTNEFAYGIAIDAEDNINVIGSFSGDVDFDADPNVDYIVSTTPTGTGTNSTDLFLAQYLPTGALKKVQTIGSNGTDIGYGLAIDGANSIHITGILGGSADFDPSATITTIATVGVEDGFVTKWNNCNNLGSLPAASKSKDKTAGLTNQPTIFASTNCEVIAKVVANGASPISGMITAKVWVETTQPSIVGNMYVKRHYEITPATNATTASGRVTLYFTQQEFNDFNAVSSLDLPTGPTDIMGIANLLVEKRSGTSNNGTGLPASYTNAKINIDPVDGDIVWNQGTQRWEVTFITTGFSGFFLKTQTSILPIRWLNINGNINKQNQATINFTVQENNVKQYEIEKSVDGYTFEKNTIVKSNGDGEHTYSLVDYVKETSTIYYRVKQIDNTGSYSYSSILKLMPYASKQVFIYPNPVEDFAVITVSNNYINTPAIITDMNGKILKSFQILNATFSVDIATFPSGIYFLKLKEGKAEKIIKQ